MSALYDDLPTPHLRALRFARPAWEREPMMMWEPVTGPTPLPDAAHLRLPDALAPYVRSERHFQLVVRAVLFRVGQNSPSANCAPPYRGDRLICARRVLTLLHEAPDDPLLADLLLLLFPPTPCGSCGRPYLRENGRRAYCSDRCRCKAHYAATRAKAANS